MKGIKKLLTGILAATMIMGSTLSVSAAQTITITRDASYKDDMTNTEVQTYTWYRAMKAVVGKDGKVDPKNIGYYVDKEADMNALAATNLFNLTESKIGDTKIWNVFLKDANTTGPQIAEALNAVKTQFTAHGEVAANPTSGSRDVSFEVDDGYYLIVSELGSLLIADTAGREAKIAEKNKYPELDKQQRDATDNGNWLNKAQNTEETVDVKVGDTIAYQLIIKVPNHTSDEIIISDTMTKGLVIDGAVTVTGYGEGAKAEIAADGKSFTVKLPTRDDKAEGAPEFVDSVITFNAKVTAEAITASAAERKNEATLEYGNYHQKDFVPYTMERTAAFKYDGALKVDNGDETFTVPETAKLTGVEFTLKVNGAELKVSKADNTNYYVPDASGSSTVVTDDKGYIIIRGLDVDGTKTYTLTETKTLAGFNLPVGEDGKPVNFELTVVSDNSEDYEPGLETAELKKIENNKGTLLPSTGGVGTTMFYIFGSILIVAGVAYFILRRKGNVQ
jgi:fimbrial isopeptide formation D2 family protein/LPXTG-motif cell wall-anchored protein